MYNNLQHRSLCLLKRSRLHIEQVRVIKLHNCLSCEMTKPIIRVNRAFLRMKSKVRLIVAIHDWRIDWASLVTKLVSVVVLFHRTSVLLVNNADIIILSNSRFIKWIKLRCGSRPYIFTHRQYLLCTLYSPILLIYATCRIANNSAQNVFSYGKYHPITASVDDR